MDSNRFILNWIICVQIYAFLIDKQNGACPPGAARPPRTATSIAALRVEPAAANAAADSLAPTHDWPALQAPAPSPPPSRQAPRLAGLRPGAPRHPPPGCLRAAGAARRAPPDQVDTAAAGPPSPDSLPPRGCLLPIPDIAIPCSAIGDLETHQEDTRCRGKWGHQSASGRKALVVGHSLRAQPPCRCRQKWERSLRPLLRRRLAELLRLPRACRRGEPSTIREDARLLAQPRPHSPAPKGAIIRQTVCLAAPALPVRRDLT